MVCGVAVVHATTYNRLAVHHPSLKVSPSSTGVSEQLHLRADQSRTPLARGSLALNPAKTGRQATSGAWPTRARDAQCGLDLGYRTLHFRGNVPGGATDTSWLSQGTDTGTGLRQGMEGKTGKGIAKREYVAS